jgi:hypothetical protein
MLMFIIFIVISVMCNLDAHILYHCILISRMNKNEGMNDWMNLMELRIISHYTNRPHWSR